MKNLNNNKNLVRVIAFYLPQYHPIPENDEWWGKGFTEWTNVAKAKPLFKGHYQPRIPADLGFYDLRLPETRERQAELAKEYGIEGFAYWHYWFGNGKRLLERPFNEVLKTGKPDFPFCLAWANEDWTGIWHGAPCRILMRQKYPGEKDYVNHFYALLQAFFDKRYLRVEDKPIFCVYRAFRLPNPKQFTDIWRNLAVKEGLKGIYFIATENTSDAVNKNYWNPVENGFDATNFRTVRTVHSNNFFIKIAKKIKKKLGYFVTYSDYTKSIPFFIVNEKLDYIHYPTIITGWDNTPRSNKRGAVLTNYNPETFRIHVKQVLTKVQQMPNGHRIIFLKSWNEWAEGNYIEPDLKFGNQFLQVLKQELFNETS